MRIIDKAIHAKNLPILKVKVLRYRLRGWFTFCRAEHWNDKWTQVMRRYE